MDSDDRILDLFGLLIVLGVVAGVGILVFFGPGGGPVDPVPAPEPPDAEWTAARVNATHVQIGHAGGDPVDSEDLLVTAGGEERSATWSGRLSRGDVGLVPADDGETVTLYWTGGSAGNRTQLGTWDP